MAKVYPSTIVKAARKALAPLGFSPFNEYYVAKPLSSDASAFVQVSAARAFNGHSDEFTLRGSFGLRIATLHTLFASLSGWGDSPDFIGISYSPLSGANRVAQLSWLLSADKLSEGLSPLVEAVANHVLPEMRQVCTAEAACRQLLQHDNDLLSWQSHWWVPIAHITIGQPHDALRVAQAELASARSQSSSNEAYLKGYGLYVQALQSRLAGG